MVYCTVDGPVLWFFLVYHKLLWFAGTSWNNPLQVGCRVSWALVTFKWSSDWSLGCWPDLQIKKSHKHLFDVASQSLHKHPLNKPAVLLAKVYLVGCIPTPLKNMSSSLGIIIPNIWKNKIHVPNHQPGLYIVIGFTSLAWTYIDLELSNWHYPNPFIVLEWIRIVYIINIHIH